MTEADSGRVTESASLPIGVDQDFITLPLQALPLAMKAISRTAARAARQISVHLTTIPRPHINTQRIRAELRSARTQIAAAFGRGGVAVQAPDVQVMQPADVQPHMLPSDESRISSSIEEDPAALTARRLNLTGLGDNQGLIDYLEGKRAAVNRERHEWIDLAEPHMRKFKALYCSPSDLAHPEGY